METITQKNFTHCLNHWFAIRSLNKKPKTQLFYSEIKQIISQNWHEPQIETANVSEDDILFFAEKVAHHCPSRWNTIVSFFQAVTPQFFPRERRLHVLKRKRLNIRHFVPPNQMQFSAFLAQCDGTNFGKRSKARLVVNFLCFTGMRINEARGIRWKNVLPDRIDVPAELTKSGKMRSVPILFGLDSVLAKLRTISADGSTEGFVLPRENPRKAIEAACVRAGVPKMSFHCFRHYFATKCIESNVDKLTVAQWLGHQDGGTLLGKTYFHLTNEHSLRMAALVKIMA